MVPYFRLIIFFLNRNRSFLKKGGGFMDKEIKFKFDSEDEIKKFCDVLSLLLENKKQKIEISAEGSEVIIKVSSKKRVFLEKMMLFLKKIKKEDMSDILKFAVIVNALRKQPSSTVVLNKAMALI